jgi:beta-lactamase class D
MNVLKEARQYEHWLAMNDPTAAANDSVEWNSSV